MNQDMNMEVSSTKLNSVVLELDKIKNYKTNLFSSLIILLLTISLFIGYNLLFFNNPIQVTIIIIIVLFIHESGHLLFMKIYNYKNLSMFFIPFLGAAVTGNETDPDDKKKAIVSIMGPLPGIILGIITFLIFIKTKNNLFYQYSFISLLINGFNLLPIYPLDGGRFFDYVIFSRNKYIEIFFKIAAITLFFYISISIEDWTLILFAFLISFTIPTSIQIAKISHKLKKEEDKNSYEFSENIPNDFIINVMKNIKNFRGKQPKKIANIVSNVWNRFFTKPPKVLTSILLIISYLLLIFIVIIHLDIISTNNPLKEKSNKIIEQKK